MVKRHKMKRIRVEEIDGVIYIDGVDIIKKLSELSKERIDNL